MRRLIEFSKIFKSIIPYSKILFSLSTCIALNALTLSPSKAAIEFTGDIDTLVETVIKGAANSMGRVAKTSPVRWAWCDDVSYASYNIISKRICLNPKFIKELSKAGKAPIAFVVAHEYAHHVQFSSSKSISNEKRNTKDVELQADCYAGIILATTNEISFDLDEVKTMIYAASQFGDYEYDSYNHHGSGENRALALRSGLRFGSSQGKYKDAYYNYCLGK